MSTAENKPKRNWVDMVNDSDEEDQPEVDNESNNKQDQTNGQQEQTSNSNEKSSKSYEDKVESNHFATNRHGQNGHHHSTNGNHRNREEFTQSQEDMQKEVEMQNTEFITLKIAKKDTYITEKVVQEEFKNYEICDLVGDKFPALFKLRLSKQQAMKFLEETKIADLPFYLRVWEERNQGGKRRNDRNYGNERYEQKSRREDNYRGDQGYNKRDNYGNNYHRRDEYAQNKTEDTNNQNKQHNLSEEQLQQQQGEGTGVEGFSYVLNSKRTVLEDGEQLGKEQQSYGGQQQQQSYVTRSHNKGNNNGRSNNSFKQQQENNNATNNNKSQSDGIDMFRNSTNKGVKPVFSNTKRTNTAAAEVVIPSSETTAAAQETDTAKPAEEVKVIEKDISNEGNKEKDHAQVSVVVHANIEEKSPVSEVKTPQVISDKPMNDNYKQNKQPRKQQYQQKVQYVEKKSEESAVVVQGVDNSEGSNPNGQSKIEDNKNGTEGSDTAGMNNATTSSAGNYQREGRDQQKINKKHTFERKAIPYQNDQANQQMAPKKNNINNNKTSGKQNGHNNSNSNNNKVNNKDHQAVEKSAKKQQVPAPVGGSNIFQMLMDSDEED